MFEISWKRVGRLIWFRLPSDLLPLGIAALVLAAGQLLLRLLASAWDVGLGWSNPNQAPWVPLVVIGCFLTSARGFRAMQSSRSGTDWLLLPASSAEKYLAALLETQLLFPIAASVTGLLLWLVDGHFGIPSLFEQGQAWGLFLVTNLIFLTGSTVFRKQAALKTAALGLLFLVLMLGIPGFILAQIEGAPSLKPSPGFELGFWAGTGWSTTVLDLLWNAGMFFLTPLMAVAYGFFHVQEKEAHDAVQ